MDFVQPNCKTICKRGRYVTGHDRPYSENNGQLWLEPNGSVQLVGGRTYLCSFLAYIKAHLNDSNLPADVWVMLFDATSAKAVVDLSNPLIVWRVPSANQPDTIWYEPSDAEVDEVHYQNGATLKVGAFFEQGVRLVVSSQEFEPTPIPDWGYVSKADFVIIRGTVGGVA